MAAETVLDYLGHPCQIAKAMHFFEDSLKESRTLDPRELARKIGELINSLNHRAEQTETALKVALSALPRTGDDDATRAVLEMASPYHLESCNMLYDLSGHVLAALEHGKLVEVPHG